MVRIVVATMAVIASLALPASAYDLLYSGESAEPGEDGALRVELALLYLADNDAYGTDGAVRKLAPDWTATWIPVKVSYAIGDVFAVGANVRYGFLSLEGASGLSDGDSDERRVDLKGHGLDDVWIWGKWRMLETPVLSARAAIKLPVGSEPADRVHAIADTGFFIDENGDLALGGGQMDIDGALLLMLTRDTGAFEASLGYRYRATQSVKKEDGSYDFTPGGEIHFTAGYVYHLNAALDLRLGLDGFAGSDDSAETDYDGPGHSPQAIDEKLNGSARSGVWINPSLEYVMDSGIILGFDTHYPLMGKNIAAEWGVEFRVGLVR